MQLLRRLSRSGSRKSSASDPAKPTEGAGSADGGIAASSAVVTERDLADQARISSDWLSTLSSDSSDRPKGILKNSEDASKYHADELEAASTMTLEESLKVAQANALANQGRASKTGDVVLDSAEDAMLAGDDSPIRPRDSEPVGVSDKKVADADGDISMGTAVEWDEANLEQNETERVPRMKIDEPKTPFHERPAELDDPSLDPLELPSAAVADAMSSAAEEIVEEVVVLDESSSAELVYGSGTSSERIERRSSVEEASGATSSTMATKDGALMADSDYQNHLTKMAVERRDAEVKASEEEAGLTDDERRALEKKRKFAAKRKAHYDEFHAVKAMKKKKLQIKSTWEVE